MYEAEERYKMDWPDPEYYRDTSKILQQSIDNGDSCNYASTTYVSPEEFAPIHDRHLVGRIKDIEDRLDDIDPIYKAYGYCPGIGEFGRVSMKETWCKCGDKTLPTHPPHLPREFLDGLTDFKGQWIKYSGHEKDGDEIENIIKNHDRKCAENRISNLYAHYNDSPLGND